MPHITPELIEFHVAAAKRMRAQAMHDAFRAAFRAVRAWLCGCGPVASPDHAKAIPAAHRAGGC